DVAGLKIWLEAQKSNAASAARSSDVQEQVLELLAIAAKPGSTALDLGQAPAAAKLDAVLTQWTKEHHYTGYMVADVQQRVVASKAVELLDKTALPGYSEFLLEARAGKTTVSHPFPSVIFLIDSDGRASVGLPTMYAAAPMYDASGRVFAMLAFRLEPEKDFTRILSVAKMGDTGETYAFNRDGLLLSESRFDEDLKKIGLIPDRPLSQSILKVELRDPGGSMMDGFRPATDRSKLPLTTPVADAVAGHEGVNVTGYRDYRGAKSIGAWTWLPQYDFGVLTEIDTAEALAPLSSVRTAFWGMFGLLALSALAIFIFTLFVSRLQQRAQHEALKARQLGQYKLEAKIGQGAMGVVYRGHHAMLRRPTAIKLLDVEKTTEVSIARFEREVRLTSQLSHPNTISIYDFGRTPEGIFYYAMEMLDGINLDKLVEEAGPLPEGRVIYLLMQLCGSLNEAHGLGLIHRDVKPANIMVCRLGGMFDVAKLLDFGLVKAVDAKQEAGLTAANAVMGTPLYMSPETVTGSENVDARSDLYSLGCVGYFLLTGTTVFSGASLAELFRKHTSVEPVAPSQRLRRTIDPALEALILRCLAKLPGERPASAEEVAEGLARCESAGVWTPAAARVWWIERKSQGTAAFQDTNIGPQGDEGQCLSTVAP
ncbi:MAG TPA: serine/threonine protein kinase, partial [Planctomycetaceae bacterium]